MISEDQQRVLIALTLTIPLSYALQKIKNSQIKYVYSFVLGTLTQYYVYGVDVWMVFLLHCFVYGLIKVRSARCGALVTILTLCILSSFHIYRMIVDYGGWSMDLSTILMTMICKYSLFAYAVQDGHSKSKKLTEGQEKNKIEKVPSFLRYLSYCLFLPTSVIGTAIQYKHFEDYMEGRDVYSKIPSPWKTLFFDLGYSLVLVIFYLTEEIYFPCKFMQTSQFLQKEPMYIFCYSVISVSLIRFKYYFGWKYSMGAIHASGISYQKLSDGSQNFNAVQTCNPEVVESTKHLRVRIANWNISCQQWLRKSIYERSPFKNKMYGQLLTFMVSAFWHGYYGGYYFSFFFWFCIVHLSQLIFSQTKKQNSKYVKLYKKTGIVGRAILWILSYTLFTHIGASFIVLSAKQSFKIMQAIYFIPQIGIIFGIIFFTIFGTKGEKGRRKKKEKVEEEASTDDNPKTKVE